jgi:hypothetical protein
MTKTYEKAVAGACRKGYESEWGGGERHRMK